MRVLLIPLEVERWADPQGRSIESSFPSGTGPRRPELPGERNAPTKIDMAAPSVALALGGGPPWEGVLPGRGSSLRGVWATLACQGVPCFYLLILGNTVAWAVQRSRCRAILEFDASVPDA